MNEYGCFQVTFDRNRPSLSIPTLGIRVLSACPLRERESKEKAYLLECLGLEVTPSLPLTVHILGELVIWASNVRD
jgi:hypothetical protein